MTVNSNKSANAQEERQLKLIGDWLKRRGYNPVAAGSGIKFEGMPPASYAFRLNLSVVNVKGGENVPMFQLTSRSGARAPVGAELRSA